jgi:protease YdgD
MKTAALCLALTALPALAQDSSGLTRLTTREELRGFEPVGRVDFGEEGEDGFCTGVLIAADLVLTAAHCLINPDQTPVDAATITFRAGLADGVALAESAVLRTVVPQEYRWIDPSPFEQMRIDVGLMQLAEPIPSSLISPFVVAAPGAGDEVSVVSYADGREAALSWQRACNVVTRQEGLILVDCDVTYGSSGAPVLDRSHYRAKIVSIISAGYDDNGRQLTWGMMDLPDLVARLKDDLRAGRVTSEVAAVPQERSTGKRITVGGAGFGLSGGDGDTGARFVKP